jgi:hypothetical protein
MNARIKPGIHDWSPMLTVFERLGMPEKASVAFSMISLNEET